MDIIDKGVGVETYSDGTQRYCAWCYERVKCLWFTIKVKRYVIPNIMGKLFIQNDDYANRAWNRAWYPDMEGAIISLDEAIANTEILREYEPVKKISYIEQLLKL